MKMWLYVQRIKLRKKSDDTLKGDPTEPQKLAISNIRLVSAVVYHIFKVWYTTAVFTFSKYISHSLAVQFYYFLVR